MIQKKEKILVSACLMGELVRYNAERFDRRWELLERWQGEGRLVTVCPEVAGGLPVPRPAAEIIGGSGEDVRNREARLLNINGDDVTEAFRRGAELALQTARRFGIKMAVLKERSPSCGVNEIYDGRFSGNVRAGEGVTTALLRAEGIRVFSEEDLPAANAYLKELESNPPAGGESTTME